MKILTLFFFSFLFISVHGQTDYTVNSTVLEDYFKDYILKKRPAFKILDVTKVNGVKKEIDGQRRYDIDYELILEAKQILFISEIMSIYTNGFSKDLSYMLKQPAGWDERMNSDYIKLEAGQRVAAYGLMKLGETDNGWKVMSHKNKKYKLVGKEYMTENMILKEEERKKALAEKLDKFKNEGDWKNTDMDDFELTPLYLHANNVPFFKYSDIIFSIEKGDACRNDIIKQLEGAFEGTIAYTNRYDTGTEDQYVGSENKASIRLIINSISYTHQGMKENGRNKGYECQIKYELTIESNLTNPSTLTSNQTITNTAFSSLLLVTITKQEAFNSALKKVMEQVRSVIYQIEPISLPVTQIVLDAKGKPDYIVFETTNKLFPMKKIKFVLHEKAGLSIINNTFNIGVIIGEVYYMKRTSSYEIKCKIKGRKLKTELMKYIGKEDELLGFGTK